MRFDHILLFTVVCSIITFKKCECLYKFDINYQTNVIDNNVMVHLPEGRIRGHVLQSFNGFDYYAFQEIPYAAPPIGKNRFKAPKNPDPWQGILNTTANTKACFQEDPDLSLNKTEDCLYLNVYVPKKFRNNAVLLPVFVWFHGGGFLLGTGAFSEANPGFFMDYDIILVTMNYRLGPFGFLSTDDGVVPGNLGLKDQRYALRWVNKNIGLFGGDPTKVTIGGHSSGGIAVSIHLISQNSNGLFRGAIQSSGNVLARIEYSDKPKQYAFQLGNILDENINQDSSSKELLDLLQKTSASELLAASSQVKDLEDKSLGYLEPPVWVPTIEHKNESNDPLLTTYMYESYLNGNFHHVPVLIGYNSEEILLLINGTDCPFGATYDSSPSIMISRKLNIPIEKHREAGYQLKQIYTNSSFSSDVAACAKYSSDVTFQNPLVRQAEITSKFAPAYLYRFAYVGQLADAFYPQGRPAIPGTESVGHAEDLVYIWQYETNVTSADLLTIKRLHTLWSNFVKYLNPTPKSDGLLGNLIWPKVCASDIKYLNINNNLEMMSQPRYYQQVKALFKKYQRPPFVTW